MPSAAKTPKFYTDFTPYWGLPLMVLQILMICSFFAVEFILFPYIKAPFFRDVLSGLFNPALLVISFYVASLIYLFTEHDYRLPRYFTLSALILAGLGALFHLHLPDVVLPDGFVARYFMMLFGSSLGTLLCIFYRRNFCGKITKLV